MIHLKLTKIDNKCVMPMIHVKWKEIEQVGSKIKCKTQQMCYADDTCKMKRNQAKSSDEPLKEMWCHWKKCVMLMIHVKWKKIKQNRVMNHWKKCDVFTLGKRK